MAEGDSKKHILINGFTRSLVYTYPKDIRVEFEIKQRNRNVHGNRLLRQLEEIREQFRISKEVELPEGVVRDDALYVEFFSEWGYLLKFESLEPSGQNPSFQILSIQKETRLADSGEEEHRYKVLLVIREGGVSNFIKKVREYLTKNFFKTDKDTKKKIDTGNPTNNALISNIESIQLATLKSFWTDEPEISFPNELENVWWEVWFRRTSNDDDKFNRIIENLKVLGVEINVSELLFAEHRVRLVRGTANQLSNSLLLLDNLAELRKPQETADFILHKDISYEEKAEWLADLISRTEAILDEKSVLICLLDSGVSNHHALISPFLPDDRMYSYKPDDWGVYDGATGGGHGTGMAGLSLFGDMVEALASRHRIQIFHGLESFKIIHDGDPNDPKLYGAITEYATSAPIADKPTSPRVFCLSVTDKNFAFGGRPSAWSSAIDKIAFGSSFDPVYPQLFIVSSGNVEILRHDDFPSKNHLESVHDPSQAYNSVTVGSYTRKDRIDSGTGYRPLARSGEMAPSNSTSLLWESQWPIKPDIVMEGGNSSTDGTTASDHHSLKLLTADKEFPTYIFQPFGDTSAAAALASKLAAEIKTAYPSFSPETVRGLLVHSAEWTETMLEGRKISEFNESERRNLLRSVGYGVPVPQKALASANNSLTLIAERTIQPYRLVGASPKYNQYHLFELPWPADVLRDTLFEKDVTLKVTLSYFIEPNPGSRRYTNNFHYHSHSLEFAVIKPLESPEVFRRRISADADLPEDERDGSEEPWVIKRVRSRGSIKKDFITTSGAEVAARNIIAVFPKSGWYKTRKKLGKVEAKVRYTLIVTIETPEVEVDLYSPVTTLIENLVDIS